jgi:class 3 adenylate cyclase
LTLTPGWDDRNRFTLRFLDPEVERLYQANALVSGAQLRSGPLVSAGLWVVGGWLAPIVTHAVATPIYVIAGAMSAANLAALPLASWATTFNRQQALGFILNVLAGMAVLAIAALTNTFETFAAPALMLIGIFAFIVLRFQFTLAAVVTAVYVASFWAIGIAAGSTGLALNLFLVTAAVVVACGGTYVLESAQRRVYAQGLLITSLHEQVNQLFHQYLSPDVAATLLGEQGRADLGGDVVELTVLFADLQGFTPYSERTDPAAVVALLNGYFEAAVPAIFGEGGTIVQFAGDAVMAIWNAPLRQPDHAYRAARAALDLQAAVGSIGGPEAGLPRFRVGLNTGPALVGNIGSQAIRNFTAIGDTTNLAARLQTFADPGHVVIGQTTFEQIRDIAIVRPLGAPQLKGKTEPVLVYELIGLRPGSPPATHLDPRLAEAHAAVGDDDMTRRVRATKLA